MAARVNVRFVAIVCGVIAVIFVGMAAAAYFVVQKSAQDHYTAGETAYAAGDFVEAERAFSKAVNKDRFNIVYLERWIESLQRLTPDTETRYTDVFFQEYMPALRQLAVAKRTDADAWASYLETQYQRLLFYRAVAGGSSWRFLLDETDVALRNFATTPEADDPTADWNRLRRYRGLANLNMVVTGGEADSDFRDQALADLAAALLVDPDDTEALLGRVQWIVSQARDADRRRGREADRLFEQAQQELDAYLAAHPGDARAILEDLRLEMEMRARPIREIRDPQQQREANQLLAAEYAPRIEQVVARLLENADPGELSGNEAQLLWRLETVAFRRNETPLTNRLLAAARASAADDATELAELNFVEGLLARESGDHDRAIRLFQQVAETPPLPISLDGIFVSQRKTQAAIVSAQSAVQLAQQAEGDAARQAARQRVTELREALDAKFGEGLPQLDFLDARIAFLDGRTAEALRLAIGFQRATGSTDPELSRLLSLIYLEQNQPGLALEQLEAFIDERPNSYRAWLSLAQLHEQMNSDADALQAAEEAFRLAPDAEIVTQTRERLQAKMGIRAFDDPIDNAVARVEQLMNPRGGGVPKFDRAIAVIRQTAEQAGADPRLYMLLIYVNAVADRLDAAIAAADEGLSRFPGDESLLRRKRALEASRTVDGRVAFIRENEQLGELSKHLNIYRIYLNEGLVAEADAELDKAYALEPQSPQVVERMFNRAVREGDMQAAERFVREAVEQDLDQAGGRIFQARLLSARGEPARALDLLRTVASDGITSAGIQREIARLLAVTGQVEEAVAAYEDALRIDPTDAAVARTAVATIRELGRPVRALEIARRAIDNAGAQEELVHVWLVLEAEVGDSTRAMLRREDMRSLDAGDRRNNLALARLYVQLGEWAKGRALIDELAAGEDSLEVATVAAAWHAEQGRMGDAVAVFDGYLQRRRDAGTLAQQDAMTYAAFLSSRGQRDRAIAVLREYSSLDDEARTMERNLAQLLLVSGRGDEAIDVIDGLIAGGADEDGVFRRARIEALITSDRLDEARDAIGQLSDEDRRSEVIGLLSARIARRQGDLPGARRGLDEVIARHPSSALAYTRRAELIWARVLTDEQLTEAEKTQFRRDAEEDLAEAVRLNPALADAYRLRAAIAMDQRRYEEAGDAVAEAVRLNPRLAPLRTQLVGTMVENARVAEAMGLINRSIEDRPGDVDSIVGFARLMAEMERPNEATTLFEAALAKRRNPQIAAQFVEHLSNQGSATARRKAREVLNDPLLNVEGSWVLPLLAARLSIDEGASDRAVAEARQSFNLVRNDPSLVVAWFNALASAVRDHPTRLELARQVGVAQTPNRIGEVWLCSLMLADESTEVQGLDELRQLAGSSDDVLAQQAGGMLGSSLYNRARYSEAEAAWRTVIERNPEDGQTLNNLAYLLATEMDDCEEAIALAERARATGRMPPQIVGSTLATAYIACDRLDEAESIIGELLIGARGTPEEVLAIVRRGQWELASGRADAARRSAEQAATLLERYGGRAESYRQPLEELRAALGG
ncbi:MAG: tetratricopeptide repeat protein [Planctomycetota bacterium]